ncbi:MAG: cation diffusion facilitator family transporter [Kiritimatiellia bacterium]|jgi:cation diffusion facilitator family transporter
MSEANISRERAICRVTYFGAWINAALMAAKFLAGVFGHSAALVADAVHSLSDFATDLAVVVFIKVASKPSDECHDFGHGKFETLSSVVIGLTLFAVGVGIFLSGVAKIRAIAGGEEVRSPGLVAFVAAVVSIGVKECLYRVTRRVGERHQSPAVIANAWEHRSDAFSSLATALGVGGAILLGSRWVVLDPIAAVVVSVMIVKVAYDLVKPGIDELLEKSLPPQIEEEILAIITAEPAVSDPHNLRTRRVGVGIVAEVHVRLDGDMSVAESHALTERIEERFQKRFGEWAHLIIHVEPSLK